MGKSTKLGNPKKNNGIAKKTFYCGFLYKHIHVPQQKNSNK